MMSVVGQVCSLYYRPTPATTIALRFSAIFFSQRVLVLPLAPVRSTLLLLLLRLKYCGTRL